MMSWSPASTSTSSLPTCPLPAMSDLCSGRNRPLQITILAPVVRFRTQTICHQAWERDGDLNIISHVPNTMPRSPAPAWHNILADVYAACNVLTLLYLAISVLHSLAVDAAQQTSMKESKPDVTSLPDVVPAHNARALQYLVISVVQSLTVDAARIVDERIQSDILHNAPHRATGSGRQGV